MKYFSLLILVSTSFFLSIVSCSQTPNQEATIMENNKVSSTIHSLEFTSIDGEKVSFADFKGKKILIVNTASECGFTPQYKELQAISEKYKDNLVVIGFPCNQFGGQEPGDASEIKQFCEKNYGVNFPLAQKVDVKGENIDKVFNWLTDKELNGVESTSIRWNFYKFLIDEEGKLISSFSSNVKPDSDKIISLIKN
jgi:glutathione peroxidase